MKGLIQEMHRRSLWQVLGIYLAASWIVLQVIDVVGANFGLPEWVAPAALVLLLLGLPVVLATAFVQEGVGTSRIAGRPEDPAAHAHEDPTAGPHEDPHTGPEALPDRTPAGAHHRWLTWRNAVLGGGAAFVLLALATGGYLALRAAGIGPAGTLIAQGVLEDGARVVLADFDSADPELAEVVTGALRIDLLQSPTIRVVESGEVSSALERMQHPQDESVTAEVARELAIREGYGAVIEGDVGAAGAGYVLTARIVGGAEWTSLAAFRRTAKGEKDLIDAIEGLSREIRDKAGESLRSVRGGPGLSQVTTTSLEALRAYTRAEDLSNEGDERGALEFLGRAVDIDPQFAMAHRKLGVLLWNLGIRREDGIAATTRAFELRGRLPETERHQAEAFYHLTVTGDRDPAIRAYESLLELEPDNTPALNNLGTVYMGRGRFEEAQDLLSRALAVEPFQVAVSNLAAVQFALGRIEAAEATLDTGATRLPAATFRFEHQRVRLTAGTGRYEAADSLAVLFEARFRRPVESARSARQHFWLDAVRGRLRVAERRLDDFDLVPGRWASPMVIESLRSSLARVRGDRGGAVRIILDAHARLRDSLPPGDRNYAGTLESLLDAGAAAEAERILADWDQEVQVRGFLVRDAARGIEARLAFQRGDLEGSIRLWQAQERECPGLAECALDAALGLGRAHEAAGDGVAAIADYERFFAIRNQRRVWRDAFERGPTLEHLGQLYDAQGDLENAAKYYAMFVELWSEADEELQPRVRAAQARLEEILRERG